METPSPIRSSARTKLDVLFRGIRYSEALAAAARHSFPNYYPYRFRADEPDPTGRGSVPIPYLLTLEDGTLVRVRGDGTSPWSVSGSAHEGYRLSHDPQQGDEQPIRFEPLPAWLDGRTADGLPMVQAGVSLHGDMAVINIAPGCEFFSRRGNDGVSQRCTFCAYGAPGERARHFGQSSGDPGLPDATWKRLEEALSAALAETEIRHIYLVGGSMEDWSLEGERFIELAERVQAINRHRIPLACGSGALPEESLKRLHGEGLVDAVCFNLEVWSEDLFAKICPGKNRFVGYRRWIGSLERAVAMWGESRVYTAMVAGIELEPQYGLGADEAADRALEGAAELLSRGIIPIYSLYFPVGVPNLRHLTELRSYFERLQVGYHALRSQAGHEIWDGFMCHRCAYMQLECDLDRAVEPA